MNKDQAREDAWRQRFSAASVHWIQIAQQQPQRGLVCRMQDGRPQLFAWDIASGTLTQRTHEPRGVTQAALSADGATIYYLKDEQGDGIGHYMRLPFADGTAQDLTPELPAYASYYISESTSGRFYGFMTYNQYGAQIYVVDAQRGGTPHLRYEGETITVGPLLSYDGEIAVVAVSQDDADIAFDLEAYEVRGGERLHHLHDAPGASLQPIGFVPRAHDMRILATSRSTGLLRPLIWNARTGERRDLALPTLAGDVLPLDWSADGLHLLLSETRQGAQRLYRYNLKTDTLESLRPPLGVISSAHFSAAGTIYAVLEDAATPAHVVELGGLTGEKLRTLLPASGAASGQAWRSVDFASEDGTPIQGWLMRPASAGPHPTIVFAHGGPQDVQLPSYAPDAQAWVDAGFAYMSVNYRGSESFGPEFIETVWGQPGRLESADLCAAARWLVSAGIARPDACFIAGSGYGGTLALLAATHAPDLWAGVLASGAIADWGTAYEMLHPSLQAYARRLFGGTPQTAADTYTNASPLQQVERLRGPVLLLNERSDLRSPAASIEALHTALRQRGIDCTLRWLDEPPLNSDRLQQRIALQVAQMDFARAQMRGLDWSGQ